MKIRTQKIRTYKVCTRQVSARQTAAYKPHLTLAALALAPALGLLTGCNNAGRDAPAVASRAVSPSDDAAKVAGNTAANTADASPASITAADKAVVDAEAKAASASAHRAASNPGAFTPPAVGVVAKKSAQSAAYTDLAGRYSSDAAANPNSEANAAPHAPTFLPRESDRRDKSRLVPLAGDTYGAGERHHVPGEMPLPAPRTVYNPNMYVADTYIGGNGERDRLAKLISAGVLVDGRRVKLEAFTHNYAQAFAIPQTTALGLSADTVQSKIIQSGAHTYLQIGIQAMKGEPLRRPNLNITLAIDRSGSMRDEHKLEYAKSAAMQLVNSLTPDDTFSLVAFDDHADVLVPARHVVDKAAVRRLISSLHPGGGTNIYEGLKLAYGQAGKNITAEGVNRVILLSDGQVTVGVRDPQKFHHLTASQVDSDVETSAVGVGVEFNEDLMLGLARDGKGNYHFLKDGADTQQVFASELDELSHVVARDVKLRIQLAPGVGLVRVLGAPTLDAQQTASVKQDERKMDARVSEELGIAPDRQNAPEEPGIKMLIPAFYRGDSHVVMLEIKVPPQSASEPVCKIADVSVKYKDLATLTNRTASVGVAVGYAPTQNEMIYSVNRSVKKNLLGFQTGEALTQAAQLMAQGRVGEAVQKVDERKTILDVAARQWQDSDLARDGGLLDRYKAVLMQFGSNHQLAQDNIGQYLQRTLTYNGYQMTR